MIIKRTYRSKQSYKLATLAEKAIPKSFKNHYVKLKLSKAILVIGFFNFARCVRKSGQLIQPQ